MNLYKTGTEGRIIYMRIGMAQTNPTLLDVEANVKNTIDLMQRYNHDSDLLIFPELSLSGYLVRDRADEVALSLDSPELNSICEASKDLNVAVMLGFVEQGKGDVVYNSAAFIQDGSIKTVQRKIYPPTYGIFDEGKYFAKGKDVKVEEFGPFDVTMLICADLWHPSLFQIASHKHTSLLIGMINSPEGGLGSTYSSSIGWERVGQFYSSIYGCYVVIVNRVGMEEGLNFFGNSMILDPFGNVVERCLFNEEEVRISEIDIKQVKSLRKILPTMRDEDIHFTIRQLSKITDD
jgi:predicted amidohydrolase